MGQEVYVARKRYLAGMIRSGMQKKFSADYQLPLGLGRVLGREQGSCRDSSRWTVDGQLGATTQYFVTSDRFYNLKCMRKSWRVVLQLAIS
jgi:hypothetical protein